MFDRLKEALVDASGLAILDLAKSTLFVIKTDASDITIGLVLSQV